MQAWKGRFFNPFWSKEINNEWIRNLLIKNPKLKEEHLRHTERDMNTSFPEAEVDGALAHQKIQEIKFKDEGDRHVIATAIAANADYIFTMNLKDFPQEALDHFGIRAINPDAFFSELSTQVEIERMARVFVLQIAKYKYPPLEAKYLIGVLERSGMRRTSEILRKIV